MTEPIRLRTRDNEVLSEKLRAINWRGACSVAAHQAGLDSPAAGGENFQARVAENKDLVDKGDRKMAVGGTLLGAGVILLGVGFVLTF